MEVKTTRFGIVSVPDDSVFTFSSGLLGFPTEKKFAIISEEGGPLKWMQSINTPELAFVICDPLLFAPDYQVKVKQEELASIGVTSIENTIVMVILVLKDDPNQITANLLGPLVLNTDTLQGKQLVLSDLEYSIRHKVLGSNLKASAS